MKCFRETSACGGAVPALSVSLACALGVLGTEGADTSWNFEAGLTGWTQTGTAFQFQPTYGNNAAIRYPGLDLHLEGNYWIGTYENRPASWAAKYWRWLRRANAS